MRKGLITGLALLATALPASAQEASPQALQITALNVTAVQAERDGTEGVALPGDVIEYGLRFTNVTDADISDVHFTDPVPPGLVYILGTVTADREDVVVDYSVNGGIDWSHQPTVDVTQPDGSVVRQPAPAAAYTHVRWTISGTVAAGAQVTARFRAQVPGTRQGAGS